MPIPFPSCVEAQHLRDEGYKFLHDGQGQKEYGHFPSQLHLGGNGALPRILAELNAQLDVDEKSHDPEQDEEEQEDAPRRPSVLAALEEKSDKSEPVKPFRSYYDKDGDAR